MLQLSTNVVLQDNWEQGFHIIADFLLFQCHNEYLDAVSICRVLLRVAGVPVGELYYNCRQLVLRFCR